MDGLVGCRALRIESAEASFEASWRLSSKRPIGPLKRLNLLSLLIIFET